MEKLSVMTVFYLSNIASGLISHILSRYERYEISKEIRIYQIFKIIFNMMILFTGIYFFILMLDMNSLESIITNCAVMLAFSILMMITLTLFYKLTMDIKEIRLYFMIMMWIVFFIGLKMWYLYMVVY